MVEFFAYLILFVIGGFFALIVVTGLSVALLAIVSIVVAPVVGISEYLRNKS